MGDFLPRAIAFVRSKFFREGVPFMLTLLVGTYILKMARDVKYEYEGQSLRELTPEEEYKMKLAVSKDKVDRSSVELQQKLSKDIKDWRNIRAPRPGEDSKTYQEKLRREYQQAKQKQES